MKMFMILLAHSDGVFIYFLQLEKGTGGGRSFGFFNKDPEQAKQDKRGRVDSNIEEVSKGPGGGGWGVEREGTSHTRRSEMLVVSIMVFMTKRH